MTTVGIFYNIAIFFLGTLIGSFLNVCIYRLPRKESIVRPRSRCPHCKKQIAWYDNVPVFSFIALRGKCRRCMGRISSRYLLVEVLTGGLSVFLFYRFGLSFEAFIYALLFYALVVVTFIDIDYKEIPDIISLPGIFIGLLFSALYPAMHGSGTVLPAVKNSLFGVLAGGGMIYGIGVLGEFIFKKEAMGGGDVKLLAMIGAFLGWKLVLVSFFVAPFFGSIVGIAVKLRTGQSLIPYGPFLSLGGFIALFWGNDILSWLYL